MPHDKRSITRRTHEQRRPVRARASDYENPYYITTLRHSDVTIIIVSISGFLCSFGFFTFVVIIIYFFFFIVSDTCIRAAYPSNGSAATTAAPRPAVNDDMKSYAIIRGNSFLRRVVFGNFRVLRALRRPRRNRNFVHCGQAGRKSFAYRYCFGASLLYNTSVWFFFLGFLLVCVLVFVLHTKMYTPVSFK